MASATRRPRDEITDDSSATISNDLDIQVTSPPVSDEPQGPWDFDRQQGRQPGWAPPQGQQPPGPNPPPYPTPSYPPPYQHGGGQQYGQYGPVPPAPFGGPPAPPRSKRRRRILIAVATGVVGAVVGLGVRTGVHAIEGVTSACDDKAIQHHLTAADVPTGFRRVTAAGAGHGVTLAAPQALTSFDLTQDHLDAVDGQADKSPGQAGALAEAKGLIGHDGVLLLYDNDSGDNLSIIRDAEPPHCRLPHGMARSADEELTKEGAQIKSTKNTHIGGRPALRVDYLISDGVGGQIRGTQVYLPAKDAMYILTLSSYTLSAQDIDAITGSVRLP